ncbi:hypothetical protein QWZ06_06920 [Chryseobacterium tructae]|uniref:YD repeat-containing protein n=1 Tax=Chryseobacterium tructae TaxID=1037380 RepID=A0ABV7XTZ9_9FLAO|nr:hypothetical protein [Chryseobacterium tructae]MDN3692003.1 hypothetical protein [Chryseobacterium tructae]
MKNYLFLGMMSTVVFFSSCSSNDDNETKNEPTGKTLLLSKVTTTYYDDPSKPKTVIKSFEYNSQGELIKQLSAGKAITFEYSNGKPIKANYYNAQQQLDFYSNFYYTGSQLNKIKNVYSNQSGSRTINYAYNSNGQLSSSTLCKTEDCSNSNTTSYTYSGDNISVGTTLGTSAFDMSNRSEYSYDNKLNPYTNINKYLKIMMGEITALSKNNYLINKDSFLFNGSWTPSETTTFTIQYNNSGFPVKATGIGSDGNLSVQYDYEYISQ